MRSILKVAVVLTLLMMSSAILFAPGESDAAEKTPDGSIYTYETHGSAHPNYYCVITDVLSITDVLYIPAVLEGYDVRYLDEGSLDRCDAVALIVPAGVKGIEDDFSGCSNLKDLYFLGDRPDMAEIPGDIIIHHMEGAAGWSDGVVIKVVTSGSVDYGLFPDGWMVLGGESDNGLIDIEREIEGIAVTSIGPYAFAGTMKESGDVDRRKDITTATLPEGLIDIRERAFYYCDIQSINYPSSLRSIHDEAFRGAYYLEDPSFNYGLRFIGFESFRDCHSIKALEIPDTVKDAGDGCFKLCTSLRSAVLGHGMLSISSSMFFYDSELKNVTVWEGIREIGQQAFYNCSSLESIEIPNGVSYILAHAFRGCSSLHSVTLGDVKELGPSAFRDCTSLHSIELPSTVEVLGQYCFADCTSLKDIYAKGQCPEGDDTVFLNDVSTVHCNGGNEQSWKNSIFGLTVVNDSSSDDNMPLIILGLAAVAIVAILLLIRYRNNQ